MANTQNESVLVGDANLSAHVVLDTDFSMTDYNNFAGGQAVGSIYTNTKEFGWTNRVAIPSTDSTGSTVPPNTDIEVKGIWKGYDFTGAGTQVDRYHVTGSVTICPANREASRQTKYFTFMGGDMAGATNKVAAETSTTRSPFYYIYPQYNSGSPYTWGSDQSGTSWTDLWKVWNGGAADSSVTPYDTNRFYCLDLLLGNSAKVVEATFKSMDTSLIVAVSSDFAAFPTSPPGSAVGTWTAYYDENNKNSTQLTPANAVIRKAAEVQLVAGFSSVNGTLTNNDIGKTLTVTVPIRLTGARFVWFAGSNNVTIYNVDVYKN